jgi:MtN3 and saliva related transmembrane protein
MITNIEILGIIAGICTTLSFIPQLKKTWKTKSTKDISLFMYLIYSTGLILWTIYGFLMESIALIFANSLTLVFALSILGIKLKYERYPSTK